MDRNVQHKAGRDPVWQTFPWSAFLAHLLTAAGAGVALLALMAAAERRWTLMFAWLGLALIIDGVDGTIARWLDVKRRLQRWSGDVLDLVVDILTYVFVPAYAIIAAAFLPDTLAIPLGLVIVVTGVLYFADSRMKSDDNYFFGFPAVWNVVAFYFYVVAPPRWLAVGIVLAFAAMTFLPVPFLHPFRVKRLRALNIALTLFWAALAIAALVRAPNAEPWIVAGLCALGAYFLCAGLLRRSRPADAEGT